MPTSPVELLNREPAARVLIVRFSAIGDIIQLSAVPAYLKARWPACRVEWVTKASFALLVQRIPGVDKVWAYDPRTGLSGLRGLAREVGKPLLLLDMHSVPRSLLLGTWVKARYKVRYRKPYLRRALLFYFGYNSFASDYLVSKEFLRVIEADYHRDATSGPQLVLAESDFAEARDVLAQGAFSFANYAALVVGAAWPQKRWPSEYFVELGRCLWKSHGLASLVLGGPEDTHGSAIATAIGPEALSVCGSASLLASLALTSTATLVVGNDTGLMHGAEALGRDVAVILGPTSRETGAHPWRLGSTAIAIDLPCRPCSQKGDRPCQLPRQECLLQLTPRRVLAAVSPYLQSSS